MHVDSTFVSMGQEYAKYMTYQDAWGRKYESTVMMVNGTSALKAATPECHTDVRSILLGGGRWLRRPVLSPL